MSFIIEVSPKTIYNAGNDLRTPVDTNNPRYVLDLIEKRDNVTICLRATHPSGQMKTSEG